MNQIGYTGQRLDAETGLMPLGNGERYYLPGHGRFIQQDSWTGDAPMPQSLNRFAYVNGNPTKYTDPSGHLGFLATTWVGAVAGFALDFGLQTVERLSGDRKAYDWDEIGQATKMGAAIGAGLWLLGPGIAEGATAVGVSEGVASGWASGVNIGAAGVFGGLGAAEGVVDLQTGHKVRGAYHLSTAVLLPFVIEAGLKRSGSARSAQTVEGNRGISTRLEPLSRSIDYESYGGEISDGGVIGTPSIEEVATRHANRLREAAQGAEDQTTSDLVGIAEEVGAEMYGLDHNVKELPSLTRKLVNEAQPEIKAGMEGGRSYADVMPEVIAEQAAKNNDTLRYTMLFGDEGYVAGFHSAIRALRARGYTLETVKNFWLRAVETPATDRGYRGINSTLRTPEGQIFELQFHTPEGIRVKGITDHLYQELRKLPHGSPERVRLEAEQLTIGQGVLFPPDVMGIPEFPLK